MNNTYSVITAIFADGHREYTVAPNNSVKFFTLTGPFSEIIWGECVDRFDHCPITEFDFSAISNDEADWIKDHYYKIKADNDAEHLSVAQ